MLERNDFEQVYSDAWWYKLKQGTACYGVFWDNALENGLGDIAIKRLDLLNVFWEQGVTDIQKSRNLFIVDLVDNDILETTFTEAKSVKGAKVVEIKEYVFDDNIDTSEKTVVVDWYYKKSVYNEQTQTSKTLLHYCKFAGDKLLFSDRKSVV